MLAAKFETDPRKHIIESLVQDIAADQKNNTQVLIVGDLNENLFPTDLRDMFNKVGIVNILDSYIEPDSDAISYFH